MTNRSTDQKTVDYLDHPPKRYTLVAARNERGVLELQSVEGKWVKFQDMDDYMLEGGQLMRQMLDSHRKLLKLAKEYASACINCGGSAEIIRNKSSDGDPLHDFAEPCPECEHIRDAIAKATGEHS